MAWPRLRHNPLRSLRFRLTISYVLFFAALLLAVGTFFRQRLDRILEGQARDVLSEEWGAVKGYLRIDKGHPDWFYDHDDEDETFYVQRLRQVILLADAKGKKLEEASAWEDLGGYTPAEIRKILSSGQTAWDTRYTKDGEPYLVRAGSFVDDNKQQYFVALCRPLSNMRKVISEFTWEYLILLPVMIVTSGLLGWLLAGRALRPVNQLAQTAARISSSRLSLRITPRGAGDELDRLIETFNKMMERLQASFEQTRQFSTDVSHELRTPLTAIRGQLEVALFTANKTEQYRDAIVNALQDVERLSQTIRALLLLSQAESGQLLLNRSSVDLSAVVLDIVDQFQIPAEEAKISVSAELPPQCPLEADRIQIERLVSNLLSNAVKYTPEGGKVVARVRCEDEKAVFEVEDTGIGIPESHLPHIFDRFYRVPSQSPQYREKGLGLGLSFVAWIVKAHGGTINVESREGAGTKFIVSLPAAATPAAAPVAAEELPLFSPSSPPAA